MTRDYVKTRAEKGQDAKQDLFSFVMQGQGSETTEPKSVLDLSAECIFLILAGSDTTSTTLAASFFYLSRNLHVYAKAACEVRENFDSVEDIQTGPQLQSCRYLRACLYETLRMSPPVGWPMYREVEQGGAQLNGQHIPAGCDIGVSQYALYHNEDVFEDSFSFAPERWLADTVINADARKTLKACNPFSMGPTSCLGRTFAMMELELTLARVLYLADFKMAEGPTGRLGEGSPTAGCGREKVYEFQLRTCLTSIPQGPILTFERRL